MSDFGVDGVIMFSLKTKGENGTHIQNLKTSKTDRSNDRSVFRRPVETDHLLLKFIWAHSNLVDREVLAKLNIGDKSAIEEALNQIHFRSLGVSSTKETTLNEKVFSPKTYREVLLNPRVQEKASEGVEEGEWQKVSYKKKKSAKVGGRTNNVSTIFLHNIPDNATGREIWSLFKECGKIQDIILPRKRDKLGKRYGFVKTFGGKEAGAIICNAKMDKSLGIKIKMSINDSKYAIPLGNSVLRKAAMSTPTSLGKDHANNLDENESKVKEQRPPSIVEEDKKPDVPFNKTMFEFIEVEVDHEVEKALLHSKVGITWFDEEVCVLKERFNDMGLRQYRILGLSKRKFLISKDNHVSWDNLDQSDLSVWFCSMRNFEEADHILSRPVWLECRGLPMPAWREENLRAFTDRLGSWISWSYQSDNLGEIFNPLVCIDTPTFEEINEDMKILYKGRQINISFVEVSNPALLIGKVLPMEFSNEVKGDNLQGGGRKQEEVAKEDQASQSCEKDEQKLEVVAGEPTKALALRQEKSISNELKGGDEDWGSDPCLRVKQHLDTSVSLSSNKVGEVQVGNFKNIRHKSTSSGICSERSHKMVDNEKSEAYASVLNVSSQSTLCSGIVKKLRVKSRRGRPKKANLLQRNPFEIGVKFKVKGGKRAKAKAPQRSKKRNNFNNELQLVPVNVIGSNVREALAILESAENMGLVCNEDRDEVIKVIVRRLDSKEL